MLCRNARTIVSVLVLVFVAGNGALRSHRRRKPPTAAPCGKHPCVWGDWSAWGRCDGVCGKMGNTTRVRSLIRQATCERNKCAGETTQWRPCFVWCGVGENGAMLLTRSDSSLFTCTHARMQACTHARTHAHTLEKTFYV